MSTKFLSVRSLVAVFRPFHTVAILSLFVTAPALPQPLGAQVAESTASHARVAEKRVEAKAQMLAQPLGFEPNHGQVEAGVDFVSRGRGYSLLLSGNRSTFLVEGSSSKWTDRSIDMELVDASAAVKPRAERPLPGQSNYLMGNDPSRWIHGVQQFQQVRLANAYPGIDVLYYGNQKQVEHDFIVSPGADSRQIRMKFSYVASQNISKDGDLQLRTRSGSTVSLEKPVAYQFLADGSRRIVQSDYAALSDHTIGFKLGSYDRSRPLIIDPVVITYSTYFGGSDQDSVVDLKLDPAGNIYVLMSTDSTDLPVVAQIPGACAGTCGPKNPDTLARSLNNTTRDFYLAKLDPTGQKLLFSTYIGGSVDDVAGGLSIASDGAIYIAGETKSTDFPLVNQYSSTPASTYTSGYPYFSTTVTRVSTDGSAILYSSLIGGGLINFGGGNGGRYEGTSTGSIAAGPNGIVYLLGYAETANGGGGYGNFVDAKNTSYTVGLGTFLAKFDTTKTAGDSLVYATTFGQPGDRQSENLWAVALDSKQNVWLFGNGGDSHPTPTPNAVQPVCGDGGQCQNAYVYELNPAGSITYASFLGGTMSPNNGVPNETPLAIAIDASDNIYLTGGTNSIDFPTTTNAATPTNTSGAGGFLTKLSPGGLSFLYSTYTPESLSLAVTPSGLAGGASFLLGTGFPVKNGLPSTNSSQNDAVFQVYDTTQAGNASLLVSSYLGAGGFTVAQTAAFDPEGNFLFGGYTESGILPVVNPFQSTCSGGCYSAGNYYPDGFISRVQLQNTGGLTLLPATQAFGNSQVGVSSAAQTSILTNAGTSPINLSGGSLDQTRDFATSNTCGSSLSGGSSCTVSFVFKPTSAGPFTGTFSIYDLSIPTSPLTVALSGTGVAQTLTLTPTTFNYGNITVGNNASQIFTLTGNSNASLGVTSYTVTGAGFSLGLNGTNPCPVASPPACYFPVQFAPTVAGPATGTLTIVDAAGTQTVALSGTGVVPTLTLTPTTFNYGNITVGNNASQIFTLTGNSNASLGVTSYTVTGAGFSLGLNGTNPCPVASPPACYFPVQFAPTVAGPATGTLTIVDAAGTQTVALSGTGVVPTSDFNVTASPASQIVRGGDIAIYTLTVAPAGGSAFNQPVTLSASGLPAGASVIFSKFTVTPQGAPVQTLMNVVTTAAHAQNTLPTLWLLTAPISAAMLMLFPWVRRKRVFASLLGVLVLIGTSGAVMGCGVTAATISVPTTITVTATSGSIVHTTTVALTVH